MVFLTVEAVWKLATIRVIKNSHKHCYHAPVASCFLAYILDSWPEKKRKPNQQQYTPPNKKTWFQNNNFEKGCLASLKTLSRSSWVTADVKSTLCTKRSCSTRIQWGHAHSSWSFCVFKHFSSDLSKTCTAVTHGFTLSILQNPVLLGTMPQA